jgi:hypothetical protein
VETAWQFEPHGVSGRAVSDADVVCWNCGELATVAARPPVPIETRGRRAPPAMLMY